MLLVVVTAVLAFVTIGGLGFVFVGPRESPASKRTKAIIDRPSRLETATKRAERDPNARRKQILKSLKEQEKKQRKASVTLAAKLYQAGLRISPLVFWGISLGLAVFVFGVTTILFGMKLPIAAMLSVGFGLGLPRWVVGFLGKRRAGKFVAAFPDATDIIVRGVKSGLPAHDCLKIIGKEVPEPLGSEFRRLMESVSMGMPLEQALDQMYGRMPLPELRFFTIVIGIQQKTGGNLAEALGNLSGVLRARKMMREKIKALSGEATASASIIGVLPPGVMLAISILNPAYIGLLFTDPRGNLMLLIGGFWMALGIFVMRRMINFKF